MQSKKEQNEYQTSHMFTILHGPAHYAIFMPVFKLASRILENKNWCLKNANSFWA